jgi:hypothetical protein
MKRVMTVTALLLGCALVATGCGGRLTDAQILARSGVRGGVTPGSRSASAAGEDVGGGPSAAAGPTTNGGPTAGAAGPAGAQSSATAKGVSGGSSAAGGGVGTPGETGPVVLGNVGTYSGPAGASTAGIPRAVQVWAAAVNHRGGLFGRQVQVIVQDDGGDPARFASAVQDLVENRHVIAFVGESTLGLQAARRSDRPPPTAGPPGSCSSWPRPRRLRRRGRSTRSASPTPCTPSAPRRSAAWQSRSTSPARHPRTHRAASSSRPTARAAGNCQWGRTRIAEDHGVTVARGRALGDS